MLTDFFVADESNADAVASARPPAKKWLPWFAKDLDDVKLRRLWSALPGTAKKRLPALKRVGSSSDEGPWVHIVPPVLVERVADLSAAALPAVARRWAQAEEFALDGWQPADVLDTLTELRAVCQRARQAGKSLLLRVSL